MNAVAPHKNAGPVKTDQPKPALSVAEARRTILTSVALPRAVETVALAEAHGRTLAAPLAAKRTQPPFAASAMDGYAIRADDLHSARAPVKLTLIGESAAGHGFAGTVGPMETVRIFTGAPVPEGTDTILIQELVTIEDGLILPQKTPPRGRYIREAGLDFQEGEILLPEGRRLSAADLALAAAMNHAVVPVTKQPRVGILATGDELVRPGEALGPSQIVSSNSYAIAAQVRAAGGLPVDLGIAGDNAIALAQGIAAARMLKVDVLVISGGVSVGDYDLVRKALLQEGMELSFWRIAMRPGRPLIHGMLGDMAILGLPGNPVAALVCGLLFLTPLVRILDGEAGVLEADPSEPALLAEALPENDAREDFLRATYVRTDNGLPSVTPFAAQDSSLLHVMAEANCLLIRPPHAPTASAGDPCRIIRLDR
ncbi:gephyrin-like molybdotransferase Glp [Beijerinckia indica]|uniref:Molybdopterin molybdenumtransferase n=1 Tax=Beijerinckia indica subsp. indica (strain ATCC 9039 / DSM 1715 / NCIMB 8712) TaxID=395963 RepID=B2IKL9_BEII9|nr:gephyrin-like molybdotransferase Glp [Beijerinckia indica]ACB95058.1 molybdenum cofactor synthesis domain protein [Beijerinckia indica subsp. indica ATCC 9039]